MMLWYSVQKRTTQGGTVGKSVTGVRLLAAALLAVPLLAHAVGLGRLTVLSALGQPLNADVQIVSLQPGEEDSLRAAMASQAAFSSAGIQFNPALLGVKFAIEHRGDQVLLHLSTSQPINDPFLDMLIELQWASGRLVREYTFLLDPPNYAKRPQPIVAAPLPPAAPAEAPIPAAPAQPEAAAPAEAKPAGTYEVKKGDTLGKIAREHLSAGVTLNQMLVALYRANKDAFIHENINLVRAGRILDVPSKEAAEEIDPDEAREVVMTHMREFAEYRQKLAEAVAARKAQAAASERTAAGRITEGRAEAAPPPERKDHLTLSKAEPKQPTSALSEAAKRDDRAALQQALNESQSRVADLEKNVADLKKLIELKNAQLAELEKKGGAAAAGAPAAKPAQPPAAAAGPAPKPAAPAPKPAAPKPSAPKPAVAPKAAPKPVAPPPEPSFVDELLGNPLALAGLAGVIVLLAGYGAWAWRRKKAAQTRFQERLGAATGLGAPSVAGAVQPAAAGAAAGVSQLSVSPTGLGPGETEEVDPIAEADVYMAYGRDAQAEEILKEALQKDPNRAAIHAKLLEIYANRRDTKNFEQRARNLKGLTHGSGAEWDKVAKLGRSIDPQNPLYADAVVDDTVRLAPGAPAPAPALDLDLGGTTSGAAPGVTLDVGGEKKEQAGAPTLDFDLGTTTAPAAEAEKTDFAPSGTLIMGSEETKAAAGTIDFDLGALGGESKAPAAAPAAPAATPAATAGSGSTGAIDFDFSLDLGAPEKGAAKPAAPEAPAVDLSAINLDLGAPGAAQPPTTSTDPKWQEVATKLDLAKAYEEMGDKDGARELLNEALKEGDAAQQSQARQMLASLG